MRGIVSEPQTVFGPLTTTGVARPGYVHSSWRYFAGTDTSGGHG